MPILPENRHLYPADWRAIRAAILDRAAHQCETCKAPDRRLIRRGTYQGRAIWIAADASAYCTATCADTGDAIPDASADRCGYPSGPVHVVLTIAHLDHDPRNNDPANLRAWCQRCHNRYDTPHRVANRRARRERAHAEAGFL